MFIVTLFSSCSVPQGFSKAMSGFVKLGLINSEPCPILHHTSSPVSWVRTSAEDPFSVKNGMMKTSRYMVERLRAAPPASFSSPSFSFIKQAVLELFHLKRLTVEVRLLKSLLLSIAACQHQGCSEPRLSDTDESLQQIMFIVFHPFEMTEEHRAACSGSVYHKSKHD